MRNKAGNMRRGCNQTKLQQAMLPDITEYKIYVSMRVYIFNILIDILSVVRFYKVREIL